MGTITVNSDLSAVHGWKSITMNEFRKNVDLFSADTIKSIRLDYIPTFAKDELNYVGSNFDGQAYLYANDDDDAHCWRTVIGYDNNGLYYSDSTEANPQNTNCSLEQLNNFLNGKNNAGVTLVEAIYLGNYIDYEGWVGNGFADTLMSAFKIYYKE